MWTAFLIIELPLIQPFMKVLCEQKLNQKVMAFKLYMCEVEPNW